MSNVFVLNHDKSPLNPVHHARSRILLREGKAAVFRRYPFTIIMKEQIHPAPLEPLRVKLDPGSKTTGVAVVNDAGKVNQRQAGFAAVGHALMDELATLEEYACLQAHHHPSACSFKEPFGHLLTGHTDLT